MCFLISRMLVSGVTSIVMVLSFVLIIIWKVQILEVGLVLVEWVWSFGCMSVTSGLSISFDDSCRLAVLLVSWSSGLLSVDLSLSGDFIWRRNLFRYVDSRVTWLDFRISVAAFRDIFITMLCL